MSVRSNSQRLKVKKNLLSQVISFFILSREDSQAPGKGWRCWKLKFDVDSPIQKVIDVIMDINDMARWNTGVTKSKVLMHTQNKSFVPLEIFKSYV